MAANDAELKILASLDDKATAELVKLAEQTRKFGEAGKKAFDDMEKSSDGATGSVGDLVEKTKKAGSEAETLGKKGKEAGEQIGKGFKQAALQMLSVGAVIGTLKQRLTEFFSTFQDVEVTLARIQSATGATDEVIERLSSGISTIALEAKNFVKEEEVAVAVQTLLNEKFATTEDVLFKVSDALLFSRLQGITLGESIQLLVDANDAFANGTRNSVDVLSKLRFVQKETASDLKLLTTGFTKIGNTAQATGVSLEDLLASFTVLRGVGTSEAESIRFLESILKSLQISAGEINEKFELVGQTFSAQSVQTAGLSNTLRTLFTAIEQEGGDANEELKKIFGSQDAVNAAFAIAVKNSDLYNNAIAGLTKAAESYGDDLNTIGKTQGSASRAFSEALDVIDNYRLGFKRIGGDVRDFNEAYKKYAEEQARVGSEATKALVGTQTAAGNVALNFKKVIEPLTEFGPLLTTATSKVDGVSKAAAAGLDDVERWFAAISGAEVDADVARINKEIEDLRKQAVALSAAGAEGFAVGGTFGLQGLAERLDQLAAYEKSLLDQLAAKRKADTDKATADKEEAVLKAAEAEARSIEDLAIQRAQADKEEFDRRIRQAQEIQRLTQDLVRSAMGGGESSFVTSIESQARDLGAEISKLQGRIANETLSEEELGAVLARIDLLKAGITQLTEVSIKSGEALGAGFAETINTKVKDALNTYQTGVELAQSVSSSFTNTLSGLFNDLVLGSKSASQAFKDFIRGLIAGLVQAINQAIASKIVASILASIVPGGAPIAAASGGVVSGSMGTPKTFAKGGIMAGAMMAGGLPMHSYAEGGVARSPQVAIFGEGKGAEAFVPLPGPNRGIPVEFKSMPTGGNITINYNPSIQALDGNSTKEVLLREARVIGDIIASEIATGSNRSLTDVVRSRATRA